MRRLVALALAVVVGACGEDATPPASPSAPPPAIDAGPIVPVAVEVRPADRLAAIARLVGRAGDAAWLDGWAAKVAADPAAYAAFVDEILAEPRFGRDVVPALMLGAFGAVRSYYALPSGLILRQAGEGDELVYHLRAPCTADEAIEVAPWWDLGGKVKVCPDSYRPDKWVLEKGEHAYRSDMPLACDSQVGSPELENQPLCGCGPSLIRCFRDMAQWEEASQSLRDEVRRTTQWNVESKRPVAELFTSNQTFRDRRAELYYRRQDINARQQTDVAKVLAGLDGWPDGGQLAPRKEAFPGQHAGILTTPQILHSLPDRRQRQRGFDEILWCAHKNSFGATTERILDLNKNGNLAFVHDSWQALAHTPLCTNCHARLDYGFQFFFAYPDSRAGTHALASLRRPGKGPMFVRDDKDPRGEAELTPAAFAALATAQPEFEDCVTQQVVGYVLGTDAAPDDVAAVRAAVAGGKGSLHDIVRTALLRLGTAPAAVVAAAPAATPVAPAPTAATGDAIALGGALRDLLDERCVACHDEIPFDDKPDSLGQPFDLEGDALPRRLLVRALDRVAFHQMPPKGMPTAERAVLVEGLIDALWTDPAARADARAYFVGRARGLPAQLIDQALDGVQPGGGARSPLAWGEIERAIWVEQSSVTPGYLATVALEALRSCKAVGTVGGIDACLEQRFSPERLVRSPPAVTVAR